MGDIKISAVIPIYNKEKYLKRCIDSLMYQTLYGIEIILIDDGSKDSSEAICRKYTNDNIFYYKIINSGVSAARNLGIKKSLGKYITFIDADDFLEKTMLEKMYFAMMEADSDIIICGMNEILGEIHQKVEFDIPLKESNCGLNELVSMNPIIFNSCCNKLFKREIINKEDITFLSGCHNHEDLNFVIKYLYFCRGIKLLDLPLYNYFRNSESVTNIKKSNFGISALYKEFDGLIESYRDVKLFFRDRNRLSEFDVFVAKKYQDLIQFCGFQKSLQNCYIKHKRERLRELIFYSKKLTHKNKDLYTFLDISKLKIRMLIGILFRPLLREIFSKKEST